MQSFTKIKILEPGYKATFKLTMTHDHSFHALSSMRIVDKRM